MNAALMNLGRGAIGMTFLILVCYILSNDRKAINWKLVILGVLAQIMFAMGVLHTTVAGQPIFWLMFGVIVGYTIFRKFGKARSGEDPIKHNAANLGLSILWQALLVIGLVLATKIFGQWANLAMLLSGITLLSIAFKMGARFPELMKWNILVSSVILTACVYTRICPPRTL